MLAGLAAVESALAGARPTATRSAVAEIAPKMQRLRATGNTIAPPRRLLLVYVNVKFARWAGGPICGD
jgi:hypothetical protein